MTLWLLLAVLSMACLLVTLALVVELEDAGTVPVEPARHRMIES
jgi:hypothetical protein